MRYTLENLVSTECGGQGVKTSGKDLMRNNVCVRR